MGEFFRTLFKVIAGLAGLLLTLAGFFGFFYGIFTRNIPVAGGSILALTFGTLLGKFARGDYD